MMNKSNDDTNVIIISRVFDAPREKVWEAWTKPEHVAKWWGPNGFTTPVCEMDFRVGGKSLFCMRSSEGNDFWCGGVYQEIIENELIVCTDYFTDKDGNKVPPTQYGMEDWPKETIIRVIFEDEGEKTRLTVRHEGVLPSKDRDCAESGWSETLDRLSEYVEQP
jgi:uncharacterized protein YndB with AHSA1/START domain